MRSMVLRFLAAVLGGAVVGSLLTTVVERLPLRQSFLSGRSRCPHCRVALRGWDLLPVVSFLLLAGRCRYCRAPIPRWHLGVELAAIGLFVAAVVLHRDASVVSLVFLLVLFALLLALAAIDLREFLLPDPLVAAVAVVGLGRLLVLGAPPFPSAVIGALAGGGMLWGIALLPWSKIRRSPQGEGGPSTLLRQGYGGSSARRLSVGGEPPMGFGDVKFAAALGLTLGLPGLLTALFLAFVGGGIVGGLLVLTRRATLKSRVPFGPFLAGAAAVLLSFPDLPAAFSAVLGLA